MRSERELHTVQRVDRIGTLFFCTCLVVQGLRASCQISYDTLAAEDVTRSNALDTATQKLANSFQSLLQDVASTNALSLFTSDLASSVVGLLENVPSNLVVDTVTTQTNKAATIALLPNPDDELCTRDYFSMCPDEWTDVGDGATCQASELYDGGCDKSVNMRDKTPKDKKQFAMRCKARWPCQDLCSQDYSLPCPETWLDLGDGVCQAPPSYHGRCVHHKSFCQFDSRMKKSWASECQLNWPCKKIDQDFDSNFCPDGWEESDDGMCLAPVTYLGPCAQSLPIGKMTPNEKLALSSRCKLSWPLQAGADTVNLASTCPLGWNVANNRSAECAAPTNYEGPCPRIKSFQGLSEKEKYDWGITCAVEWPSQVSATQDYYVDCPKNWQLQGGVCVASPTYSGPCETRFQFTGYTAGMKSAWSEACQAEWPMTALRSKNGGMLKPSSATEGRKGAASEGPIAPLTGDIFEANGTVYLPWMRRETYNGAPAETSPSASDQLQTKRHVSDLRVLRQALAKKNLDTSSIDSAIELELHGTSGNMTFSSFRQLPNSYVPSPTLSTAALFMIQQAKDFDTNTRSKEARQHFGFAENVEAAQDPLNGLGTQGRNCIPDDSKCPEGWTSLDGIHCLAPTDYLNGGPCNPVVALGKMAITNEFGVIIPDSIGRAAWAKACGAQFPCRRCTHDYVTTTCPQGWLHRGNGVCKANAGYSSELKSRCGDTVNFLYASPEYRQKWAEICGVEWPCFQDCEPDYSVPCPLGYQISANGCTPIDFISTSLAVCTPPLLFDDIPAAKRDISMKCGVQWPCRRRCFQDYASQRCPYGWQLHSGSCQAPDTYRPPIGCGSTIALADMTLDMAKVISGRCHAPWPCVDSCESDWTRPCPQGWTQDNPMGPTFCSPPQNYSGPCYSRQDLSRYTFAEKQEFAFRCQASWPCGKDSGFGPSGWQTEKHYDDSSWTLKGSTRLVVPPPVVPEKSPRRRSA